MLCYKYANEAHKLARKIGDSLSIVKTGRGKSQALRRLGKLDSAQILFETVLPIARRNEYRSEIKSITNVLGVSYLFRARYDNALIDFFESLELREADKNKIEISITLNNIGLTYSKLGLFGKALFYYMQALKFERQFGNDQDLASLLIDISACNSYQGNFSEALKLIEEAFVVCGKDYSYDFLIRASQTTGLISLCQRKWEEAEKHYLKAYELSKKTGYERYYLDNLRALIKIYLLSNNLELVEKYLDDAEELGGLEISYNSEMCDIYLQLFERYSQLGNVKRLPFIKVSIFQLRTAFIISELLRTL